SREKKMRMRRREKRKRRRRRRRENSRPRESPPSSTHVPEEGPEPRKKWEYDECHKYSFSAREREWKFLEWTEKYLLARVKLTISVEDACKHVHNGLIDNGFIYGEECPSEQATTMFKEWSAMMAYQDRIDYAPPTRGERRFIENLPDGLKEDLHGLTVASRIKEAPVHPKKRRLLRNIIQMYSYSCPEEREIGLALTLDQFGLPEEVPVALDLP
ncbi:hypothetical protein PMAYCL1PPCAC_24615, partial [Pristionchus mayeri]